MSFSLTLGTYDVAWPDVDEAVEWYAALKGNVLDGTNMLFDIIFSDIDAKGKVIEEAIIDGYAVLPGKIEIIQVGQHDQGAFFVLQLKERRSGIDYPTTMALASGAPWPTRENDALFDVKFVVQRGDTQFSCFGSELESKLLGDDLLVAQRGDNHGSIVKGNIQDTDLFIVTDGDNGHKSVTGAQVKSLLFSMPWDGRDGGIFHVKNTSSRLLRLQDGPYTAWDIDGTNEREVTRVNPGEELVFVTGKNCDKLFQYNAGVTWEFGHFTDVSKLTYMNRMFEFSDSFNADISGWDTSNVKNMDYMFGDATNFNQDISGWCVTRIASKPTGFDLRSGFEGQTAKQPQWGTCP